MSAILERPGWPTAIAVVFLLSAVMPGQVYAKHKEEVEQNGLSSRLFQFLDSSYGGKLEDFYLLADLYKDPNRPDQEFRHVLRVEYDKNRVFGKLKIYVRSVGKMTPEQLSTYTPKQIYDFGEVDLEKFVKTSLGPLGGSGDIYLRAGPDSPLATVPITDDVRKEYEMFISDYILPALQKK
jgi:hypothetical protein